MPRLKAIHFTEFERFLKAIGCVYVKTEGDHNIWDKEGLKRPIVVRKLAELPKFEIRSNLRTLNYPLEKYLEFFEPSPEAPEEKARVQCKKCDGVGKVMPDTPGPKVVFPTCTACKGKGYLLVEISL